MHENREGAILKSEKKQLQIAGVK